MFATLTVDDFEVVEVEFDRPPDPSAGGIGFGIDLQYWVMISDNVEVALP